VPRLLASRIALAISAAGFLAASDVRADSMTQDSSVVSPDEQRWPAELGVALGYSPSSTQLLGQSRHRQLELLSIIYSLKLAATKSVSLRYRAAAVPIALLTQPTEPRWASAGVYYSAGLEPLGLRASLRPRGFPAAFILSADAGFLCFAESVPSEHARRFNFTFSFGTGVEVSAGRHWALTLGYRWHHLSNAFTAPDNPGIDSNLIYLEVARRR
jgi:hypothetical protein